MAAAAPYILMAASTAASASAQKEEGKMTAKQHARAARASFAEGTRGAAEARRQGAVLKSDAEASMAGMGGVTDDAGATEQLAEIDQLTDYNALTAVFEGSNRADTLNFAGKAAKQRGKNRALATTISGASNMYSTYKAG